MKKNAEFNSSNEMNRDKLQSERIRFLYSQAKTSVVGHLLSSFGVAYVFYSYIETTIVWAWLLSMIIVMAIRHVSILYFNKNQFDDRTVLKWGWFFTFMAFLTGSIWGAASFIFLLFEYPQLTLFIVMFLTGLLAASLASLSVFMWAYYAFALPTALSLIYQLVTGGTIELLVYGLMITLFLFVQLAYARVNQRTVDSSIILRNENVELIDQLQHEKDNADVLRKEAEAANMAKTKFLASASHDLRQPLHAMGLFIDLLVDCKNEDKKNIIINKIKKSGLALEGLLESLLDISKLDAGIISAHIEPFKLQSVFDAVISDFESIAGEKNICIKFVHSNLMIESDEKLIERVLRNIISNAIRYTKKGKVLVGCRRKKDHALICVYDTGSGFSSDKYEIIFTEFQQLENPERDRSKGLGLGLAIVKRLTRLLNTSIHVSSIPGKGSIFSFELPLYRGEIIDSHPQNILTLTNNIMDKYIIVVDDEEDIRDGLSSLLSSWGCKVEAISSISEAKAVFDKNKQTPDLILADYRLRDEITGVDVIHEIQHLFSTPDLPAVIITGDTAPERIKEAKASGFELLHKPVTGGKLRALLNSLL